MSSYSTVIVLISCVLYFYAGNIDFTTTTKVVTFAVGLGFGSCVHVPILNDECLEEDTESFNISISSDMPFVEFDVNEISVFIRDDDGEFVIS